MNNILNIKDKEEFREWLSQNISKEEECYLLLKRGKPKDDNVFYYLDAVEVALCFGWIDSTLTKINGINYQRFSKRNKNTIWSELNKERVRRLERLGLMTDEGRKVLPDMDINHYQIDNDLIKIMEDNNMYEIFKSFPVLYQRVRSYNITFYKNKDINIYNKAIEHFIKETKKGKMYGNWNDYGRLK